MIQHNSILILFVLLPLVISISPTGYPTQISYDRRAFTINGTRELLISGCVHYPRSSPSEWPRILTKTKNAGVDLIQTYVFWNLHQPTSSNDWYFQDRANIWEFLKQCQEAGLFVTLRIGPYVCAEWNLGGVPVWVKEIPEIIFRDYNNPWMMAMGSFVKKFTLEALERKVFAFQGGPVILAQIENEYGNVESSFKNPSAYVQWSVQLAQNLTNHEPWLMCQQDDAPNVPNLVNTCNGFYCDNWLPGHFSQRSTPAAWTENWPGWFQNWGSPKPHRPVQDIAFAVARWFARGGGLMNYYMWQGGTTWGRFTGGPKLVTSYDYDVALDEYGFPHEPKYSHSAALHAVLKTYAGAIVGNPVDPGTPLNVENTFLNLYGKPGVGGPTDCVAFLSNIDDTKTSTVQWNGHTFDLPAWSVSIVGGCGSEVTFNTATIGTVTTLSPIMWVVGELNGWSWWSDVVGVWDSSKTIHSNTPLEQITTTHDMTDYLWYRVTLNNQNGGSHQLQAAAKDIAYFYVNGVLQANSISNSQSQVTLHFPTTDITLDILSVTDGLQNYGAHYEIIVDGLAAGPVFLDGVNLNNPSGGWTHQVGLKGESLQVWTKEGGNKVTWNQDIASGLNKPLVWWKASFTTPDGTSPLALDLTGLGKGFVYVNGNGVGRYWNITASGSCPSCSNIEKQCDYRGNYGPGKCSCDCGEPSQQYYHVPRDWLAPVGNNNMLVLIDEVGAYDLNKVQIITMN